MKGRCCSEFSSFQQFLFMGVSFFVLRLRFWSYSYWSWWFRFPPTSMMHLNVCGRLTNFFTFIQRHSKMILWITFHSGDELNPYMTPFCLRECIIHSRSGIGGYLVQTEFPIGIRFSSNLHNMCRDSTTLSLKVKVFAYLHEPSKSTLEYILNGKSCCSLSIDANSNLSPSEHLLVICRLSGLMII